MQQQYACLQLSTHAKKTHVQHAWLACSGHGYIDGLV